LFVTAVESYQQIRYHGYYIMLTNMFLKMCINCLVSGKVMHDLFMSQDQKCQQKKQCHLKMSYYFLQFLFYLKL